MKEVSLLIPVHLVIWKESVAIMTNPSEVKAFRTFLALETPVTLSLVNHGVD